MVSEASQIVLIGLPGAGKSTAGKLLAESIGWKFIDLDEMIEAEQKLTVAEIFAQMGEARFRSFEADLTARLASQKRIVLAPGGGWATNPELPRLLSSDAVTIWLRVQPQTALVRLRATGVTRPLLQVPDGLARLQGLLDERSKYYERADVVFDTDDLTPHDVAAAIMEWLKRQSSKNVSSS